MHASREGPCGSRHVRCGSAATCQWMLEPSCVGAQDVGLCDEGRVLAGAGFGWHGGAGVGGGWCDVSSQTGRACS